MDTRELLKAQKAGATIVTSSTKREVTYQPRHKGDREPWTYTVGINTYRNTAARCEAVHQEPVAEPVEIKKEETVTETPKRAMVKPDIAPEVIEALRTLRNTHYADMNWQNAFEVLDNAGIFADIDEATGYDVDPEHEERVSKCRCQAYNTPAPHETGCPGDPAEWGDMAFTTARASDGPDDGYVSKVPGWAGAVEAQRKMNAARGIAQ